VTTLVVGQAYRLDGLGSLIWTNSHPVYGTPARCAALYLGALSGARTWHCFEVWATGVDPAAPPVIFMNQADLDRIRIRPVRR
jgi:hypothetical protein